MIRLNRLLVPLVLLAPPTAAQEDADELFYRAFYQETALRDFEAALTTYRRIVELDPGNARAQTRLGQCLVALGRNAEAQAALERALQLDPKDPRVQAALEALMRPPAEDELLANVRGTIQRVVAGDREQVLKDLGAYGVRALPALSEGLRSPMVEVVDLCAKAVLNLIRKGSPAAEAEFVRALTDPEVLLRGSMTVHLYSYSNKSLIPTSARSVWAHVPDIPERAARDRAEMGYFAHVVGSWERRSLGAEELLPPEEEATLRAILEDIRDGGSSEARRAALGQVGRYYRRLSAEGREVAKALLRVGMDDPGLARTCWDAASQDAELFDAVRDRLLPFLRGIPAGQLPFHVSNLPSGSLLTPEESLLALDLPNLELRVWAWEGLSARMGENGPFPAGLAERMPQVIEDRIAHIMDTNQGMPEFDKYWARYPIRDEDLPRVWRAQIHRSSKNRGVLTRGRLQVLRRYFGATDAPAAAAVRLFEPLDPADGRVLLQDLNLLDPSPRLGEFALTLASSEDSRLRAECYELLVKLQFQGHDGAIAERVPYLIADVLDYDGASYEAAPLLLARGELADRIALRAALPDDLGAGSAEDFGPDSAIATLLLAQGVDECRDLLESRYASASYAGREALLNHRARAMVGTLGSLWKSQAASDGEVWVALAEAVRENGPLLSMVGYQGPIYELPPEAAGEVIGICLRSEDVDGQTLRKLLFQAGHRDVGVEPALLLPFIRHSVHGVREAATKALENLQRYESYRRAVASFGGDARLRAVERIRTNVASGNPDLRRAAAYAIAALGDPGGVALLLDLVEDGDESVRAAALASLEKMGGVKSEDE